MDRLVEKLENSLFEEEPEFTDEFPPHFFDKKHKYVMFHITGPEQRPKSDFTGIKVLGAFPSLAIAQAYYDVHLASKAEKYAVHLATLGQPVALCSSFEQQYDGAHCRNVIDRQVQCARRIIIENYRDHTSRRRNKNNSIEPSVPPTAVSEEQKNVYTPLVEERNISEIPKIREQTYVVIGVLCSDQDLPQVVTFYGIYNTYEEAKVQIKEHFGLVVNDRDLTVGDMYAWLYPHLLRSRQQRVFEEEWRHQQETDIMNTHVRLDQEAKLFRKVNRSHFPEQETDGPK